MKTRYFLTISMILLAIMFAMNGCGGGTDTAPSNNSGTTTPPNTDGSQPEVSNITLSVSEAKPGQFISISHDTIKEGSIVKVTFTGTNGYEVTVETEMTTQGKAKTAVPAYLDILNATYTQGKVMVSIEGIDSVQSLTIQGLPSLTDHEIGSITLLFLEESVKRYNKTLENINSIVDETSGKVTASSLADSTEQRINSLNAMIAEIQSTGRLTVDTDKGKVILGVGELNILDRLLLASFTGMADELQVNAHNTPIALSKTTNLTDKNMVVLNKNIGLELALTDKEAYQIFQNILDKIEKGVEGNKILLNSFAVLMGGIAVLAAPELAGVAAATGLFVTMVTIGHDFIASYSIEGMTKYIKVKSAEGVDYMEKFVQSAVRLLTDYVSAGSSLADKKLQSAIATLLGMYQDGKSFVGAYIKTKCPDEEYQNLLPIKNFSITDCGAGYTWSTYHAKCVQADCNDIPYAHFGYVGDCVCGTSGSIYEDPSDPNKECRMPSSYSSCPGCVYACVHFDEDCPATQSDIEDFCRAVLEVK